LDSGPCPLNPRDHLSRTRPGVADGHVTIMSAGVALEVWGAADTVTGSRFLVTTPHSTTLVDCGLFQGLKVLRARNRVPFPVPPSTIDTVVLTHAHLDHSGYVPALVRDGYAGRVLCTPGTAALCGILLPDSGHLLEEEAATAGRGGWSRHPHPTPLYTVEDAERSLRHLQPIPFAGRHAVGDVELELTPAGHIVGAAHVTVRTRGSPCTSAGISGAPTIPSCGPHRRRATPTSSSWSPPTAIGRIRPRIRPRSWPTSCGAPSPDGVSCS